MANAPPALFPGWGGPCWYWVGIETWSEAQRLAAEVAYMHAACLRQYAASRWFEVKATSARRSPRKPTISCPICRKVTRERADDEDALPGLTRERRRKRPRVA